MDPGALRYALTADEHDAFERVGYLIVRGALRDDHVADLEAVIDTLHAARKLDSPRTYAGVMGRVQHKNSVGLDRAFVDLIDHPTTFPKVWGVLGWNIYVYNTHLMLTPPQPDNGARGPTGWHQDLGRTTVDMPEVELLPRLSLKVGYFLTDLSRADMGNFWMIPGSHRRRSIGIKPGAAGMVPGAEPICAEAGDAMIFDRRLWHSGSPNYSDRTRKMLFYGYAYRWIRPYDGLPQGGSVLATDDPIRRQLLEASGGHVRPYEVSDDEVPLRAWLAEHQPEAAAGHEY